MDLEAPFSHLNPSKDHKRKKSATSGNNIIKLRLNVSM